MKKICLSLILTLMFSAKTCAADYSSVGIDAFKKGSYDNAAANLEHAVRISPKNVNARYYLAQTYLMQNRIPDATNQYQRIIFIAPDSDAAVLSQKGMYLIQRAHVKGTSVATNNSTAQLGDNYIAYVLPDGDKLYKWASFPVNVYIEPKKQKSTVQKAFLEWQSKSGNLASFNLVTSPEAAQIVVKLNDSLGITSTSKDSYTAGLSKPYYEGDFIKKSEINLLVLNPKTSEEIDEKSIFSTALHEIGHSLGLKGHSPSENDIMFASSKEPKSALSQRDLNTLNLFYRADAKTLIAQTSGNTNLKFQQAIKYTKDFPDNSTGWANLGDIYRGKKMYTEAVKNYKQAISIEPDKAGLYNLLGTAYQDMGNKQSALANYKTACDLDKSNSFYLYQFSQLCWDSGQKETGRAYLKSFVKANPQSIYDEKIKALSGLYK